MQTVLFDLTATQPNASGLRHGGGKYGEIVFKRIVERKLPVLCFYDGSKWLNPEIKKLVNEYKIVSYDVRIANFDDVIKKNSVNVIYSPMPNIFLMRYKQCKVIGTIHGLRGLELPTDLFFWKYKGTTLKEKMKFFIKMIFPNHIFSTDLHYYGDLIRNDNFNFVTVSYHTKYALYSFFTRYNNVEIPVFYSPSTSSNRMITRKYAECYFMMVSGNRWEKNNLRAIMALDKLFSMGHLANYTVKITGAKDASNYRYKIQNPDKFVFLGYVDEDELEQLYHDAYCLIYPSLNEGFGYPPLEAMHYGVPVLASPFTSISEICQDAALYFNPYSIKEIMNRILQIVDKQKHQEYIIRSKKQYEIISAKQDRDLNQLINYIYNI